MGLILDARSSHNLLKSIAYGKAVASVEHRDLHSGSSLKGRYHSDVQHHVSEALSKGLDLSLFR